MARRHIRSQFQERTPIEEAKLWINSKSDRPGFKELFIDDFIGRGVFSEVYIKNGEFLLEYMGECISNEEAEIREQQYIKTGMGCFLFFYTNAKGKTECIDGTNSVESLCRLVNDSPAKYANADMKKVDIAGKTHLCLFAKKDIHPGTELRYDYGVENLEWRKNESCIFPKQDCCPKQQEFYKANIWGSCGISSSLPG